MRIISNKERFSTINEILLSNPDHYLSTEEVLNICAYEQILSHGDILRICREAFPTTQISDTNDQFQNGKISSTNSSLGNMQDRRSRKSLSINIDRHENNRTSEEMNTNRGKL
jgi:hypothetical protein